MIKKYYPYEYAESVFMIDYQKLYQKGFRGIIFDIDNTLVHHGDDSTPEIDNLFRKIQGLGLKTLLLSNNDRGRVERFIKNIDTPLGKVQIKLCDLKDEKRIYPEYNSIVEICKKSGKSYQEIYQFIVNEYKKLGGI